MYHLLISLVILANVLSGLYSFDVVTHYYTYLSLFVLSWMQKAYAVNMDLVIKHSYVDALKWKCPAFV
jgi:hypothetical protein